MNSIQWQGVTDCTLQQRVGFASESHAMDTIASLLDDLDLSVSVMEKKSARIEEGKVSNQHHNHNHIPDDLAFSVLSKLPPKSLKRFGCVSKSWDLLPENPHFKSMYCNHFISSDHSYYDDTSLLLLNNNTTSAVPDELVSKLYLLSGEKFESRVKLDWPPPFQEREDYIMIRGSVNGILCLEQGMTKIVLWNPAIKEFKVIPPSPIESVPYRRLLTVPNGFGYDHVRDDYKVIRFVDFMPPLEVEDISLDPLWEIYSLRSNSWRKLDANLAICYSEFDFTIPRVYMDGVCHWWCRSTRNFDEECLASFDLSNEVFFTTPTPPDRDDIRAFRNSTDGSFYDLLVLRKLVVLNGSITFVSYYAQQETTTFHISILGELGVKESWTKAFIVGPLPCLQHPIGTGKKGDIFFIKKDGELVWFDLSTHMVEELGVKGKEDDCQIVIYRESLLSIGEINN